MTNRTWRRTKTVSCPTMTWTSWWPSTTFRAPSTPLPWWSLASSPFAFWSWSTPSFSSRTKECSSTSPTTNIQCRSGYDRLGSASWRLTDRTVWEGYKKRNNKQTLWVHHVISACLCNLLWDGGEGEVPLEFRTTLPPFPPSSKKP